MQARAAGVGPIGTAGSYDAFLLAEVPLPWPKEIADHPALAGVDAAGARVQGVVPSPERVAEGVSLVVRYDRLGAAGYQRREVVVALDDLAGGVRSVTTSPRALGGDDIVDLLVCTHGTRDRCCGALGMSLFAGVASRPGLRAHRTSHTGGHRFAPTAVVLPQGTVWAWLDDGVLDAVLDRSRPPADLLGHYRGSTAMPTPAAQVAEAAVLAEVGWSWLDAERTAEVVSAVGERTVVRIESSAGAWEAVVEQRGTVPQAVCGSADPEHPKRDPVLELVELVELRAGR